MPKIECTLTHLKIKIHRKNWLIEILFLKKKTSPQFELFLEQELTQLVSSGLVLGVYGIGLNLAIELCIIVGRWKQCERDSNSPAAFYTNLTQSQESYSLEGDLERGSRSRNPPQIHLTLRHCCPPQEEHLA